MQYAQLNSDGTYGCQITTTTNVEWDATHFCPASALTPEEAALFRVVPLVETAPPAFDPNTHLCLRDGGELIDGRWQYRWRIESLSTDQIAANMRLAKARVLQAARDARTLIFARLDGLQASNLTKALLDPDNDDAYKANAQAIETAKEGLRAITSTDLSKATTELAMKVTILQAYKAIAGAAPVNVQLAFAGLDA